jgi:hypothetical protein
LSFSARFSAKAAAGAATGLVARPQFPPDKSGYREHDYLSHEHLQGGCEDRWTFCHYLNSD